MMAPNKILRTLLLLIAILLNCKTFAQQLSIVEKIKQTNNIEIHFLKCKQPCVYKSRRKIDLTYLKNLIANAKNDHSLKCDTTGIIIYFRDNVELAKVYFSSRETGSKYDITGAVAFNTNDRNITSRLNYGTGMLVNEEFYSLQKLSKPMP